MNISNHRVFHVCLTLCSTPATRVKRRLLLTYLNGLWQKQRLFSAGLLDNDKLPHFYYRDDAVRIWGAIHGFTTEIVAVHYRDDEDVELDEELLLFLQVSDKQLSGTDRRGQFKFFTMRSRSSTIAWSYCEKLDSTSPLMMESTKKDIRGYRELLWKCDNKKCRRNFPVITQKWQYWH